MASSRIEHRGIEYVPAEERYTTPVQLGMMWASAVFYVINVVEGALVVLIGLSFGQAVTVILIGNLTWLIAGAASLPGPAAGTAAFSSSRAAFGLHGNKAPSVFNWLNQVSYEIIDLSIVVLAGLALLGKAGVHPTTALKVVLVAAAALVQSLLPLFGHRSILRTLKLLLVPFAVMSVVMAVLVMSKIHLGRAHPGGWGVWFVGLAVAISGSGLGWAINASDFSRYIPENTPPGQIVVAVALAGAVPTIALMILGAAVATLFPAASNPISGFPQAFAGWFVVPYLLLVIVQLVSVNGMVLYSSGLTLQAVGLPVTRIQAVAIDGVISGVVTALVILSGAVNTFLSDLLLFMIVWLALWSAIYCVDYFLRRGRYGHEVLTARRSTGRYRRPGGLHPPGVIALGTGMLVALLCINTSVFVGPLSRAMGGADLSAPAGLLVGGVVYFLLAYRSVPAEVEAAVAAPVDGLLGAVEA